MFWWSLTKRSMCINHTPGNTPKPSPCSSSDFPPPQIYPVSLRFASPLLSLQHTTFLPPPSAPPQATRSERSQHSKRRELHHTYRISTLIRSVITIKYLINNRVPKPRRATSIPSRSSTLLLTARNGAIATSRLPPRTGSGENGCWFFQAPRPPELPGYQSKLGVSRVRVQPLRYRK
jgi:hypothetical protein